MSTLPEPCYLCGKPLAGKISRDHVPPKQFYGTGIRVVHNPNLLSLRAHTACNASYQKDEDYFVQSLAPLADDSPAGRALWEDMRHRMEAGKQVPLALRVLGEFDARPGGLVLPRAVVMKRVDRKRMERVAWKLARGLYYHTFARILPESTDFSVDVIGPRDPAPDELDRAVWNIVLREPSRGRYPAVFDYKYAILPAGNFNIWAMLLWDRLMLFVDFQYPASATEPAGLAGSGSLPDPGAARER